ncbi:MAG: cysteine hydrolase [Clostridia bacterium]|nr:cysteine hydrolase [Clostridia bacterium]
MQNFLIVVDMQNDFVSGTLGSEMAKNIVPAVVDRVKLAFSNGETVIFTRDTHNEDYLDTLEGKNLPIKHCIKDTFGYQIIDELKYYALKSAVIDKPTFGSEKLATLLKNANEVEKIESVTLIGLCTDICVISNAMLIKASLPDTTIIIEENATAGVSEESKQTALSSMRTCQMIVK